MNVRVEKNRNREKGKNNSKIGCPDGFIESSVYHLLK